MFSFSVHVQMDLVTFRRRVSLVELHAMRKRNDLGVPGRSRCHQDKRDVVRGRFAVLGIVVPLATFGGVAIHQQAGLAAHVAVEILHPQRLAALGPSVEFILRADEPGVRFHRQLERHVFERLDQAPFAGLGGDDLRRAGVFGAAEQFAGDRTCVFSVVELRVAHIPAALAQAGLAAAVHERHGTNGVRGVRLRRQGKRERVCL